MTIARAQMYRQLYQMGGIGTLPMDYGQSLQVPQQQQPSFSSAQNITMNPLLNYGQPQLGTAGGTPLTMASGGMSRLGYQEGGMGMMQDQEIMQSQQPQANIKDPKQALELIIQMLIAQGIPEEQAREIAIQMVQAVAEGGMGEMSDERIGARFGGMMNNGRENYGIGSFFSGIVKGATGIVKGAVNAVKKVASSDLGKAALTVAAIYASGGGFSPEGFSMFGSAGSTAGGLLGSGGQFGLGQSYLGQGLFGAPTDYYGLSGGSKGFLGNLGITSGFGADLLPKGISSLLPSTGSLVSGALGGVLGGALGGMPQQQPGESNEDYQRRVNEYKLIYQQGVSNPQLSITNAPMNLYPNNPFYAQRRANGGRIGYQEGGIGDLIKQTTQQEFFGTPMMANGGRMNYGFGSMIKSLVGDVLSKKEETTTPDTSFTSTKLDELINKGGTNSKSINFQQVKPLYNYTLEDLYNLRKENNDYIYAANGGRIGYELGSEVPTRQNQAGVKELDYRDTGGFVPPIGIKERADDIPAMLSNNEFVFTADAVRNAGGGNENLGAQRMYKLMKNLESGGRV